MARRSARLLFAATFLALAASASAALSCGDLVVPSLGNDATPGLIPAGPKLLSTTTGGGAYDFVINTVTDALEFYVESEPGVGVGQDFTRKLNIVLAPTNKSDYASAVASVAGGCKVEYGFFTLNSGLSGVTIGNETGVISTSVSGDQAKCVFKHKYSVAWETFRSTLSNCGFTVSTNSTNAAATFRKYTGRIHVQWEDYATTLTSRVRPAMDTWYDVSIQIQDEVTQITTPTNNTEIPYQSDFSVTGISYTKGSDGVVVAKISYQLSTNFPYYATIPTGNAYDYLFHTGSGTAATYATNKLGYAGSADYPSASWSNAFISGQDGRVTDTSSSACDAPGETCLMAGELTYTWTPTPSIPKSCSISSNSNYQFDFMLGCVDFNGTTNAACGTTKMRDALALPNFGAFRFSGNVDFCKSAATDFPITWGPAFDIADASRDIGQTIEANGAFTTSKKLSAVAIKEFRVARSDLTGYWSLWTAAADSAVAAGSAGGRSTDIGVNTNFLGTAANAAGDGKSWSISTSFTPNIKMYDSIQLTFDSVGSRGPYMISLPNDKTQLLSFTMTLIIRMYSDSTQNFAGARRRLMYRDTKVPVFKSATATSDSEYTTSPVGVKIPNNIQVSGDGSVTVVNTQPALSTGAIAGIAAIGAVVGGALVAMTILLVRRNQKKKAAAEGADFAAIVQAPSGDFDAKQASEFSKVGPAGSRDFLMDSKSGFKPIVPQWTSSTGGSNTSGRIVA